MRIAITGGTGCVGRELARQLSADGHEVVLIARGTDRRDGSASTLPRVSVAHASVTDGRALEQAFAGCDGVAHCAGINRNRGSQTYHNVHVHGTENVVRAAREAGVRKVVMLSFLRARPDVRSEYHRSKYAAEEIIRTSGCDYTILKPGIIYGRGDHMLDHVSHALYTCPVFPLVGMMDTPVRLVAVSDVARIAKACLVDGRLPRETVAVLGPDEMPLRDAIRLVSRVTGRKTLFLRVPYAFHRAAAWAAEKLMVIPPVSLAQIQILREGVVDPVGVTAALPDDLVPRIPFTESSIRAGLPEPGRFAGSDMRACVAVRAAGKRN